ncbi:glutamate synthase, partial [Streptomyces sp. NPDC056049]
VGLGRAALVAVDEDPEHGLERLVDALALELRLLVSALGKYTPAALTPDDLWSPPPYPYADPYVGHAPHPPHADAHAHAPAQAPASASAPGPAPADGPGCPE